LSSLLLGACSLTLPFCNRWPQASASDLLKSLGSQSF